MTPEMSEGHQRGDAGDPRKAKLSGLSCLHIENSTSAQDAPSDRRTAIAPPRRKRRLPVKRRRATVYAALLAADEYSEQARDALRLADDSAALVEVAIGQLLPASSASPVLQ
jgi:hypothetical protein